MPLRYFAFFFALLSLPLSTEAHPGMVENDYLPELAEDPRAKALPPDPEALPRDGETQDDADRRLGPWLDLKGGGQAIGNPQGKEGNYGSLERGSLLPAKGDGLIRLGGEAG